MSLFDWGIYKAYGEVILFASTVFYLGCLGGALFLLWQVGKILHSASIAILLAVLLVIPMAGMTWRSLELQHSSAHCQESTHLAAMLTVCLCFAITTVIWLYVRWRDFRRADQRPLKRDGNSN